ESATPAQYLAYQKQFAATIGTRDAALADTIAQHEAASDPKAVAAWLREDVGTDLRPDLAKIAVPVLEVMPYDPVAAQAMGGFTQAQSIAFYQALLPGVPNLRVVAVAPARHFAMLDQPDEFYAALARFMNSLPS
ncbi:MAG: alpha/beta hydrolase, partial [Candidatus Eremiobacteraeota bacterium]|nr:alpha/beta hydrolase [Candidatus Eremiobacteraeota bacterium]